MTASPDGAPNKRETQVEELLSLLKRAIVLVDEGVSSPDIAARLQDLFDRIEDGRHKQ
jgi:hypothetical protein